MDAQLVAQLRQTIYVAEPSGAASAAGQQTYGAPAARAARVELKRRLVRTATGDEVVSSHRIIVEASMSASARVWLPGVDSSDDRLARTPLEVAELPDEDGNVDHYEVLV